jgi:hypothetical protein
LPRGGVVGQDAAVGTKGPTVAQRAAAAAAAGLSAGEQLRHATDPSARVRRVIAGRADLDGGAAAALGGDSDPKVRRALAENPATPADVLITLIGDADFSTRWSAAQNPSADAGVHRAALAGPHEDTAEAIGQLGDLLPAAILETVLVHPRRQARWQLALSTSSPQVLQRLAVDPAPEVRAAVAQSDHAGQALLRELAMDSRAEVRAVAAAAASMPREVLKVGYRRPRRRAPMASLSLVGRTAFMVTIALAWAPAAYRARGRRAVSARSTTRATTSGGTVRGWSVPTSLSMPRMCCA